jgi:hypothetical protein
VLSPGSSDCSLFQLERFKRRLRDLSEATVLLTIVASCGEVREGWQPDPSRSRPEHQAIGTAWQLSLASGREPVRNPSLRLVYISERGRPKIIDTTETRLQAPSASLRLVLV